MKTHLDTSLGVMIQEPDKKESYKANFELLQKDPNPDSVVALIDIFAPLIPEDSDVMSVIETTKTEYVK